MVAMDIKVCKEFWSNKKKRILIIE
jgi:hypothetical protein